MTDLLQAPQPPHTRTSHDQTRHDPGVPFGCVEIRPPPGSKYARMADVASPISPDGFFEYDRRIKAGPLLKRTKRTKASRRGSWKTVYAVLRPQHLSLYKDKDETQLRHKIRLTDIIAAAMRKDRKRKGEHEGVFGLYTPSRTYHFEASSYAEAQAWVDTLRREALSDEDEGDPRSQLHKRGGDRGRAVTSAPRLSNDRESSSSPDRLPGNMHRLERPKALALRSSSTVFNYSGPEAGSYSDFSDAPGFSSGAEGPSPQSKHKPKVIFPIIARDHFYEQQGASNQQRISHVGRDPTKDEARTICQGFLLCLKSRSGMKQWKKYWAVLRPKHLALYKDSEEYSAILILPVTDMVDAVEIEPVSKKKQFCMQLIVEDRSFRFCASDEDDLMRWLGAIKCTLAKRRTSVGTAGTAPTSV